MGGGAAMRPADAAPPAALEDASLDLLMPMHVRLDRDGRIVHLGPGIARVARDRVMIGLPFLAVFDCRRPVGITGFADLERARGRRLDLTLLGDRPVQLRAILAATGGGAAGRDPAADPSGSQVAPAGTDRPDTVPDGAIVNLSLAIAELGQVGAFGLTCTDFAPTDLTVEMLYLIEANSGAMAESRNLIRRLQGAKSAAEEDALTDALTGLRNRRALDPILTDLAASKQAFAITSLDLDYFKRVNDTLGHDAGDEVLRHVADILRAEVRGSDTVARLGGDEFMIVFHGLVDPAQLSRIAERIIRRLERPMIYRSQPCRISASMGTALSTDYAAADPATMQKDADAALYASKKAGRGRHTIGRPA